MRACVYICVSSHTVRVSSVYASLLYVFRFCRTIRARRRKILCRLSRLDASCWNVNAQQRFRSLAGVRALQKICLCRGQCWHMCACVYLYIPSVSVSARLRVWLCRRHGTAYCAWWPILISMKRPRPCLKQKLPWIVTRHCVPGVVSTSLSMREMLDAACNFRPAGKLFSHVS